jgi:hypothetical protein
MLPSMNLPPTFARVLSPLRPCFTAPTYQTFVVLFCGFLSCVGDHTVTGMLIASGYSSTWSHHRAHRFFSRARWCPDGLGLAIADLVVNHLIDGAAAIELVVDDSLFKRQGPKVWGVFWHHDATSTSSKPVAKGTCYVVVGIVVTPVFMTRAICLPIHVKLWIPKPKATKNGGNKSKKTTTDKNCPSKVDIAKSVVLTIGKRYPDRKVHVCGDAAYISSALRKLPANITWTSRLRKDAALFEFAPPKTGRRGRPRVKGERLPKLAQIAKEARWSPLDVRRYSADGDTNVTVETHSFMCLWHGVLKTEAVKVVMVRDAGKDGYGIAIVTTDIHADDTTIIERYARRWSIEVTFEEGKVIAGVAQARNRTRTSVERTVPFCFYSMSLLIVWFATCGIDANVIVEERRKIAPWYRTKANVSVGDVLDAARRVLTASQFRPTRGCEPSAQQFEIMRLACEEAAA